MAEVVRDFPLFPLGIVALPTELVPLHIFEERYRTMIGRCLEQQSEFGLVWVSDDGLKEVGCAMEITEVLERTADGKMNIICRGTRPFRIEQRQEDLPFPAGTVAFLDDEPGEPSEETRNAAHDAYAKLLEQATDTEPDPLELSAMTAYEMAATVEFGLEAKQGLLDLRSESERLGFVTSLFRAAVKRLDYVERSQAVARSNGKVRF